MDTLSHTKALQPRLGPLAVDADDRTLLAWLRQGSQDAATELYRRYAHRLQALARARFSTALSQRMEPDDLVQSVFRRFVGQVREGNWDVPEGDELWGLLLVIALNKIRAEERFHRAERRDFTRTHGEWELAAESCEPQADHAFMELAVRESLERLPERHQEVVRLRLAGHEVTEIAQRIGRSLRTTERLLQECRTKLETFFNDQSDHRS